MIKTALTAVTLAAALTIMPSTTDAQTFIGRQTPTLATRTLTPEALWAMGRVGTASATKDGAKVVYTVSYYSVKENRSHTVIYTVNADGTGEKLLTTSVSSETDPTWIEGDTRIAFLTGGQLWSMLPDGTDRRQLTHSDIDIEGYKFSPDGSRVILVKSLPYHGTIAANPTDLPKATGRLVTDMNYRHWDHYVETNAHPFVAEVTADGVGEGIDLLKDEPYECPTAPFGGIEQLDWSADSKQVAYTCRKKTGVNYAVSTDTDIFLYDLVNGTTKNLCKPADYVAPEVDNTKTMRRQAVNAPLAEDKDFNLGYDTNPQFSPDGRYVAWQSMSRDGYESDRNRLCVYELATGKKTYVTERFDSNVDAFCWSGNAQTLFFVGTWHGTTHIYVADFKGAVHRITNGKYDYNSVALCGDRLLCGRQSMCESQDLYLVDPQRTDRGRKINIYKNLTSNLAEEWNDSPAVTANVSAVTKENSYFAEHIDWGTTESRHTKTVDGKDMHYWIVKPPHFDATKKYPTLLFCEGGPQSPVSQFWSYRWNMMIMAANGYVVIAPNRRGLPGFSSEWCEEVSGDWTGLCMKDYLSAIDDAAENLPYVDREHLGAVGASFGGFSIYYLAGHHEGRFKCFISHDGAFNLESMYTDTEETWFSNWEYDDAYWNHDRTAAAARTYENSPHRFVDKWDTPILCIHGELDYRINANQGMGAFNAARLRGIPAQLLIFPDENHWVLKPQNGILWQRTFFSWLDRWLKH